MPVSAPSLCHKCGYVKEYKERCPRCTKASNISYSKFQRDKEDYNTYYNNTRWKNLRELALKRDKGLCVMCFKENRIEKATVVDHIVEIKDDDSLAFNLDNLQSICTRHHNIKTAEQAKLRSL